MRKLVAGSRGSKLAMIQTQSIINALESNIKIKKISTMGDKITDVALSKVGGKGFQDPYDNLQWHYHCGPLSNNF